MSLALEGTPVHNNQGSGDSLTTSAFTTSQDAQVYISAVINGTSISSITGGGLTWTKRKRQVSAGSDGIELWSAPATGALAGVQFTVNCVGATFLTVDVFAFSGHDTSTIFDANASVPASGTSDPLAMTTSNAADVLIGAFRLGSSTTTAGTGYTLISGADFLGTEYKIVGSSGLQSLTLGTGAGASSACIGDAVMELGSGGGGGTDDLMGAICL